MIPTKIMIIFSLLFLLLSNAVTSRRDKSILYSRNTILIILYSLLVALNTLNVSFLDSGIGLFGGLFHATPTTQVFHIFILIVCVTILQLTAFYPRKVWLEKYAGPYSMLFNKFVYDNTNLLNKMGQQFKIIEYPLILLFITTGGLFLVSCSDIVSIFLSIELQSYGLYLLSTIYRNSELSTSAGLTYFLLGGLSSCFILLGTSLLYANSGTTSLDGYYIITGISSIANDYTNNILDLYKPFYLNISLLIMSVGFLFKISAAPFHFWSPDVYDAIPTVVTTFVAIIAKISILVFLLELVHYTSNLFSTSSFTWTSGLLLSSFLSLIIGTVLGLTQFRIKRLFAYSTISHLGFILLALSINSLESIQAFIFYLMQYSITNLNAFLLLIAIGFSLYPFVNNGAFKEQYDNVLDKNNSPVQFISQLKGYFYINPVLALSLVITLFSFVGIPPLIGFFAKQMVLSAALDSGYVFLTIIAILTSVISAVYYLGVIKQIFFDKHEYKLNEDFYGVTYYGNIVPYSNVNNKSKTEAVSFKIDNVTLSTYFSITVSTLTLMLLLFMFIPQEWLNMSRILALIMFNP